MSYWKHWAPSGRSVDRSEKRIPR